MILPDSPPDPRPNSHAPLPRRVLRGLSATFSIVLIGLFTSAFLHLVAVAGYWAGLACLSVAGGVLVCALDCALRD